MCVLSIKVPIRKKNGNLFNDLRIILVHEPNYFCDFFNGANFFILFYYFVDSYCF